MAGPSATPNTVATLNGLFKEVYGDKIAQLVPLGTKLQNKIPFVSKDKEIGNQYHQPVLLAYEQGFTFAGASAGAYSLQNAVAGVMKDAALASQQIVLRAQMDYETAARAAKGRNSFKDATGLLFESMQKSMRKRIEVELLYGSVGLGTIASISSNTLTITTAEHAPGIWAGAEGMGIDCVHTGSVAATATVQSVDLVARTVTVDSASGMAVGDTLYYQGAFGNEMAGVYKILSNSGSLFGINASTYSLWAATSYAAGSASLTMSKVNSAIALAVGKGLDEDVDLWVNPKTWGNLLSDLAAQRRFPNSMKEGADNGAKSIEFYSQNGKITIEPSIYIKEGISIGLVAGDEGDWVRPGAADVTFKTPGQGEQIFFHLPTQAGFEVRAFTDQAVFCKAPGKQLLITGIVNS